MAKVSKVGEVLNTAVSISALVLIGVVAFHPTGAVRASLRTWLDERAQNGYLKSHWSELASQGARVDSTGVDVNLVEFGDYQCPYCRQAHVILKRFLARNPHVGVSYRQMPLPIHSAAAGAAKAARCADAQGSFGAMHDFLYSSDAWMADTAWVQIAHSVGIRDTSRFRNCLHDPKTDQSVQRDLEVARSLGLSGTPSFVTSQGVVTGLPSEESLQALIGGLRSKSE